MTQRSYRTDFTRGEVIQALLWLGGFAFFSAIIQAAYLQWWWPVPAAFFFNVVLVRGAGLWGASIRKMLLPIVFWTLGLVLWWPEHGVWLLAAGIAGGVYAVARRKCHT